jgi:hypothetical protein
MRWLKQSGLLASEEAISSFTQMSNVWFVDGRALWQIRVFPTDYTLNPTHSTE